MSKKIVLDPGHGGRDSGATGFGLLEKNWTLDIAKRVGSLLTRYGATVLYTRTGDSYIGINNRIAFANSRKADYYFSFHINAGRGKGFESFTSVRGSKESKRIQGIVTNDVLTFLKGYGIGAHGNSIKTDNLAARGRIGVVTFTHMPAVLFENLFIDTKSENDLLKSEDFKSKLAQVYANSIAKCVGLKATFTPVATASSPSYTRLLKLRKPMMRGDDVRAIQRKLGVSADGIYGPVTRNAVIKFQRKEQILVDGIVGKQTWSRLFG
ncbi:N-acetylmuramoyl-L-alanine amidase [Thermoactinomyces sp. DSM 45892]|uniref:N-acetylmuramoyl-L-alanine amidase n=1 Tax=Thermoactinomyces sp. DSM 45892 TaxID=1882753 RepID=UPI00089A473C|nr:N-acetylmuramoyl-L-alanine amidase [Thermoactinomyces sp. DSM 45892]SDY69767.1 N-acetylmuramoyl-L-alanine amidase [Thermoactinomyces sp. DSM 45892]